MNELSTYVTALLEKTTKPNRTKAVKPSAARKAKGVNLPLPVVRKAAAAPVPAKAKPVAAQVKPKKAAVTVKPEVKRKGRPCSFDLAKKITVLCSGNPRKTGGVGHKAFSLYKTGMTVAQYLAKEGGEACHLRWDVKHGFISIE